jgi:hypothetical protein
VAVAPERDNGVIGNAYFTNITITDEVVYDHSKHEIRPFLGVASDAENVYGSFLVTTKRPNHCFVSPNGSSARSTANISFVCNPRAGPSLNTHENAVRPVSSVAVDRLGPSVVVVLAKAAASKRLLTDDFSSSLTPRELMPIPLGSIFPRGWLKSQLVAQKHGLSGRGWLGVGLHVNASWPGANRTEPENEQVHNHHVVALAAW